MRYVSSATTMAVQETYVQKTTGIRVSVPEASAWTSARSQAANVR